MKQDYIDSVTFEKKDFTTNPLPQGEYEDCRFIQCDFSNGDLSDTSFCTCQFEDCNLSLVNLGNTAFRDIKFKDSKLLGLRFDHCNKFGLSFSFEGCSLNHSSFYKLKLKQTLFRNCTMQEIDLVECDLTGAIFDNCDLLRAQFAATILEKADLSTATAFAIDPQDNRIKKAKFSLRGALSLLERYNIEIKE